MKVLFHFYNLHERAGIQRAICELANAFVAQGHEAVLISGSNPSDVAFELDERVKVEQIVNSEVRATGLAAWPLKVAWGVRQFWSLRMFTLRHRPSIVVDHGTALGLIYPGRFIAGVPFILQRHFPVHSFPNGKILYRFLAAISGRKIVVALSDGMAGEMRSMGIRNVAVIPNVVPAGARFSPFSESISRTALLMGRAKNPQKGFDLFLKALSIAPMRGWHFRIVGPGVESDPLLLHLVESNRLQDRVELLPVAPNPYELIRTSSCLIMPSRYEALPMVALEALSIGRPIIGSDVDGLRDLLVDEGNGLIFPCGDVDALAKCLYRMGQDDELLKKLAVQAPRSIQRYQSKPVIERWQKLARVVNRELITDALESF